MGLSANNMRPAAKASPALTFGLLPLPDIRVGDDRQKAVIARMIDIMKTQGPRQINITRRGGDPSLRPAYHVALQQPAGLAVDCLKITVWDKYNVTTIHYVNHEGRIAHNAFAYNMNHQMKPQLEKHVEDMVDAVTRERGRVNPAFPEVKLESDWDKMVKKAVTTPSNAVSDGSFVPAHYEKAGVIAEVRRTLAILQKLLDTRPVRNAMGERIVIPESDVAEYRLAADLLGTGVCFFGTASPAMVHGFISHLAERRKRGSGDVSIDKTSLDRIRPLLQMTIHRTRKRYEKQLAALPGNSG